MKKEQFERWLKRRWVNPDFPTMGDIDVIFLCLDEIPDISESYKNKIYTIILHRDLENGKI